MINEYEIAITTELLIKILTEPLKLEQGYEISNTPPEFNREYYYEQKEKREKFEQEHNKL